MASCHSLNDSDTKKLWKYQTRTFQKKWMNILIGKHFAKIQSGKIIRIYLHKSLNDLDHKVLFTLCDQYGLVNFQKDHIFLEEKFRVQICDGMNVTKCNSA